MRDFTEAEAREHDRHYQEGWKLIRGDILLAGTGARGAPGWFARRRLTKAIASFEAALAIHPEGWQSLWALGKIHQRLGQPERALECFAKAHRFNPLHPDVAREAGIAAADSGDGPAAVRFLRAALEAQPDDPGLESNLALALLLSGEMTEAREAAGRAVRALPDDPIARTVQALVEDVAAGRRPKPTRLSELR